MNWVSVVVLAAGPECTLRRIPGARWQATVSGSLPLEASSVYPSFTSVTDCRVDSFGRVCPVDLTCHNNIHSSLARVSRQLQKICQVGRRGRSELGIRLLYGAIELNRAKQHFPAVV